MKMVYVYCDANKDIVGVYSDWRMALNEYIQNAQDIDYHYIDEDEAIKAIEARIYHDGDGHWFDVLFADDNEEKYGMIFQRPLITKKIKNF